MSASMVVPASCTHFNLSACSACWKLCHACLNYLSLALVVLWSAARLSTMYPERPITLALTLAAASYLPTLWASQTPPPTLTVVSPSVVLSSIVSFLVGICGSTALLPLGSPQGPSDYLCVFFLPHTCVGKVVPIHAEFIVPLPFQFPDFSPHLPHPAPSPSIPPPWRKVGCHINQPTSRQLRRKKFLSRVVWFLQPYIEIP